MITESRIPFRIADLAYPALTLQNCLKEIRSDRPAGIPAVSLSQIQSFFEIAVSEECADPVEQSENYELIASILRKITPSQSSADLETTITGIMELLDRLGEAPTTLSFREQILLDFMVEFLEELRFTAQGSAYSGLSCID